MRCGACRHRSLPQAAAAAGGQDLPWWIRPAQDTPLGRSTPTSPPPHDTAVLATAPMPAFGQPADASGVASTETLAMGADEPPRRRFALTGRQARIASIVAVDPCGGSDQSRGGVQPFAVGGQRRRNQWSGRQQHFAVRKHQWFQRLWRPGHPGNRSRAVRAAVKAAARLRNSVRPVRPPARAVRAPGARKCNSSWPA